MLLYWSLTCVRQKQFKRSPKCHPDEIYRQTETFNIYVMVCFMNGLSNIKMIKYCSKASFNTNIKQASNRCAWMRQLGWVMLFTDIKSAAVWITPIVSCTTIFWMSNRVHVFAGQQRRSLLCLFPLRLWWMQLKEQWRVSYCEVSLHFLHSAHRFLCLSAACLHLCIYILTLLLLQPLPATLPTSALPNQNLC